MNSIKPFYKNESMVYTKQAFIMDDRSFNIPPTAKTKMFLENIYIHHFSRIAMIRSRA